MPDPNTIIKPGQFSMEIPGQISAEIDNYWFSAGNGAVERAYWGAAHPFRRGPRG
jgi:hypothetical protein